MNTIQAIEIKLETKLENDEVITERDIEYYSQEAGSIENQQEYHQKNIHRINDYCFVLVKKPEFEEQ